MNDPAHNRSIGWMGLERGHKARPGEWLAEKFIFLVSLSAIVLVFLIFVFIAREALPVLFGQTRATAAAESVPASDLDKMSPAQIQAYLQLTPVEYAAKSRETLQILMELREEAGKEASHSKDAGVNSASWRYMILPHQWSDYEKPEYIWQPVSQIRKFNLVPLFVGSLKTTAVALLFAVPLALASALYVSQLARPRAKEIIKPCIELLSGIPSVVLGFFGLIVMATVMQSLFGTQSRLNAFVAGIALGLAVIPVVFSIAEDALTSVPRSYVQAALALGSTRWEAAWKVVLPAALPGVFAAVVLGFGRAVGETMVVLMASGNASIMSWNIFDSARTITATIAAELQEAVFGGPHYRILFLIGVMLFVITFLTNLAGELVMRRLKTRLEGGR